MPIIEPFKGLRYDVRQVGSLKDVVTPPYDVITPSGQIQYYRKHPLNFVRVVFGRERRHDGSSENRYTRARDTLREWIAAGILRFEKEANLYPYLQEYPMGGWFCRRLGIIALVRLDSPRIFPHERTKEEPKEDRLRLLEAVEASLSPIFGLIPDGRRRYERLVAHACRQSRPVAAVKVDGVRHSLWAVSDTKFIQKVKSLLKLKELIIADGHHRYEASLAYRDLRKAKDPSYTPEAAYNFAMFFLASAASEEPGLLPTHRLIHRFPKERLKALLAALKRKEAVQPVNGAQDLVRHLHRSRKGRRIQMGLYTGNGASFLLTAGAHSPYDLDVEWLHREIVPRWLPEEPPIAYTQDLKAGMKQVRQGKAQALFILSPPSLETVLRRARGALRMPGKTTFFTPKPLAGLVEYKF